ncbi:MAG TPA: M24 family metallopeptidase [Candidatus Eisenbacteria bacterium]|nr:M24 family metallopeptidase [Candidatus Eisenbacteria bacterium]
MSGSAASAGGAALLVERIQEALREDGLAGWLLFDFHGTNPIARAVLGMESAPNAAKTTRRWFYLVPARGEPRKLVHRIEPRALDHLPGSAAIYLTWQELDRGLADLVQDAVRQHGSSGGYAPALAMEYSPSARLPYVSRVDGGTLELVRASGAQVVSSADLAQRFDGVLDQDARRDHRRTGDLLSGILAAAFERARDAARAENASGALTEVSLQRFLIERLAERDLISGDPPTVAVNAHSGDPHFSTSPATDLPIRAGDFLLIDIWAKRKAPGAVYADYTQVAWLGPSPPERHRAAFLAVRDARDAAIARVREALASNAPVRGADVDDAARAVIEGRGLGPRFLHRTGHSIGREVHGNGVHLDNFETRDERRLLDGTLVSVEPGVYFEDFGVRTEVNLLLDRGEAVVTAAPIQQELPALLS